MKAYQKVIGEKAINLYIDDKSAVIASMDIATGKETDLATYDNVSEGEAISIAAKKYGHFVAITGSKNSKTAGKTFKTARRILTMKERLALINEDKDEDTLLI